ncbi:Hypothetical protein, conserved [Brucella abortus str. 2308 A]|uniref:Uncharacterized protein n=1 Tax=Brucella ceti str. Cudo TaxID=595497 RepID=C0G4H0_9HYPH|nr:Hypothetical protein, conserved [Brucella ceti str. Cudo]EEP63947.1 Hypothetical protein, conserved [Brucella abortus str. 2308 A]
MCQKKHRKPIFRKKFYPLEAVDLTGIKKLNKTGR